MFCLLAGSRSRHTCGNCYNKTCTIMNLNLSPLWSQRAYFASKSFHAEICSAKAAAIGACTWRLRRYVTARAARRTFGISCHEIYDPQNPAHQARRSDVHIDAAGDQVVPGCFKTLVRKVRLFQIPVFSLGYTVCRIKLLRLINLLFSTSSGTASRLWVQTSQTGPLKSS